MNNEPPAEPQLTLTDERLRIIRDVAVTMDRAADKLVESANRYEELTKVQAFLIDHFSQKLLEKAIHQVLEEEERRQENKKRHALGGIPRRVLNGG
jgi:hypothetical protein